jgi:hypothetical protein
MWMLLTLGSQTCLPACTGACRPGGAPSHTDWHLPRFSPAMPQSMLCNHTRPWLRPWPLTVMPLTFGNAADGLVQHLRCHDVPCSNSSIAQRSHHTLRYFTWQLPTRLMLTQFCQLRASQCAHGPPPCTPRMVLLATRLVVSKASVHQECTHGGFCQCPHALWLPCR